jgi:hypothetical protein
VAAEIVRAARSQASRRAFFRFTAVACPLRLVLTAMVTLQVAG